MEKLVLQPHANDVLDVCVKCQPQTFSNVQAQLFVHQQICKDINKSDTKMFLAVLGIF